MIDTQGLLDRVFSLPTPDSLRTLLKHPTHHPLSRFRTAIQCLIPISSLPRSKPSPTAIQQHRFCTLASSLLDNASSESAPISLDLASLLPSDDELAKPSPLNPPRKYALVQHLPSGDYWTSLSSDTDLTNALKDLPTAQAELVAIIPTPPQCSTKPVPTLAAYRSTKPLPALKPLPAQRRVTTGVFLDYGPWASFAPVFDQDAQVVGQRELGEVIYGWEQRKKDKLEMWKQRLETSATIEDVTPIVQKYAPQEVVDAELEQLLPPDEIDAIKAALGTMELENAVQELLQRNQRALARLEELQYLRLTAEDGENSTAKEGSEEWDTAQSILDSLAVLASLRPRTVPRDSSQKENDTQLTSILPLPHVLHKLHRTLALEPSPGWFGTLPPARSAALRDDNTVKIRSGAATTAAPAPPTTITPTPTTTTPVPATAPVTMTPSPYPGYTYAYTAAAATQQQQMPYQPHPYRPQSTGTGTGTGTTPAATYAPYKPQYYPYAPQQQGMQQSYYGQQQQGYATAAYSGWYSAYPPPQQTQTQAQVAGGSGPGTPQPQAQQGQAPGQSVQMQPPPPVIASATAATYGSFFGGTAPGAAGAARTPAVANTVYAQAQGVSSGAAPTLPAHLRTGQPQPQPQTQTPAQAQGQQTYYGTHQTPSQVR